MATSEYSDRMAGSPMTDKTIAAAHRSIDALGERASRSEQALRDAAARSAGKYVENRDYVRTRLDTSVERTRRYLREHPYMAAGTAFAAGALVTALLRNRDS